MQLDLTNTIETTVNETSDYNDEFTFDIEELDGNRAISFLIAPLDPPSCHC